MLATPLRKHSLLSCGYAACDGSLNFAQGLPLQALPELLRQPAA